MAAGICSRCKKGVHCRLLQPGTWVEECDLFDATPEPAAAHRVARMGCISETVKASNPAGRRGVVGIHYH
jgi:hypothetical protein